MKNYLLRLIFILSLLFFVNSCDEDDNSTDTVTDNNKASCEALSFTANATADDSGFVEYTFEASEVTTDDGTVVYDWSVDGTITTEGGISGETNQTYKYKFTKNGTYEVCVLVETVECPTGVKKCESIVIDNIVKKDIVQTDKFFIKETGSSLDLNGGTCPGMSFEYINVKQDPALFTLTASEYNEADATIGYTWFVNDEIYASPDAKDNKRSIEYRFEKEGEVEICVFIETPKCPNGVKFCREFTVTAN